MAKDRESRSSAASASSLGSRSSEAVSEMARRMLAVGLSGFFTTEEALRKALGDTIPRDWIDFAAQQSDRTRKDMSEAIARELGRVLERVDLAELLAQVFEGRSVEVSATIRLSPRGLEVSDAKSGVRTDGDE